jgi:hypothetical protein
MQPVKNSKGAWVPGFAMDQIDAVASLGTSIEETDKVLKQVCNDIAAVMELSGSFLTITSIAAERNKLRDRVLHCEKSASTALKRALDKDPHTSPAVLMQRSDISEAYSALERAKSETREPLADLETRLAKARQILEPYEA